MALAIQYVDNMRVDYGNRLAWWQVQVSELCASHDANTTLGRMIGAQHHDKWLSAKQSVTTPPAPALMSFESVCAIGDVHADMALLLYILEESGHIECIMINEVMTLWWSNPCHAVIICGDLLDGVRSRVAAAHDNDHEEIYLLQLIDRFPNLLCVIGNHEYMRVVLGDETYCGRNNDCSWKRTNGGPNVPLGMHLAERFPMIIHVRLGMMDCLFMHTMSDNLSGNDGHIARYKRSNSVPYITGMNRKAHAAMCTGLRDGLVEDALWGREIIMKPPDTRGINELLVGCGCNKDQSVVCIGHTMQAVTYEKICVTQNLGRCSSAVLPCDVQMSKAFILDGSKERNILYTMLREGSVRRMYVTLK